MIEICNLRKEKPKYPYDFKVDRSNVLGNPFPMNNESERNAVCEKYRVYFFKQIEGNNIGFCNQLKYLIDAYERFGKLRLFCWCSPKKCHAETIRGYIEKSINR